MRTVEELMEEFGNVNPVFDHFGLFTYDKEKAARFLLSIPGAKIIADRVVDFPGEIVTVGKPVKIDLYHIEVCGMDIEVIQPVDSPESYIAGILERHGDSFHHLALTFASADEHMAMCRILEERGYRCVFEGRPGNLLVHYYEHDDGSCIAFELKSESGKK